MGFSKGIFVKDLVGDMFAMYSHVLVVGHDRL